MRLAVVLVLLALVVGCDSEPRSRYEWRRDVVVDRETGLTYHAGMARAMRERYRELLVARGEVLPGVPEMLTAAQRDELSAWEAAVDDCESRARAAGEYYEDGMEKRCQEEEAQKAPLQEQGKPAP